VVILVQQKINKKTVLKDVFIVEYIIVLCIIITSHGMWRTLKGFKLLLCLFVIIKK